MDFLHGAFGLMIGLIWGLGPWLVGIYFVSKFFTNFKLLNQSVIDLQKRVKQLEGEKK